MKRWHLIVPMTSPIESLLDLQNLNYRYLKRYTQAQPEAVKKFNGELRRFDIIFS
jgi:DNA-directed RNA polymerase subunit F